MAFFKQKINSIIKLKMQSKCIILELIYFYSYSPMILFWGEGSILTQLDNLNLIILTCDLKSELTNPNPYPTWHLKYTHPKLDAKPELIRSELYTTQNFLQSYLFLQNKCIGLKLIDLKSTRTVIHLIQTKPSWLSLNQKYNSTGPKLNRIRIQTKRPIHYIETLTLLVSFNCPHNLLIQ